MPCILPAAVFSEASQVHRGPEQVLHLPRKPHHGKGNGSVDFTYKRPRPIAVEQRVQGSQARAAGIGQRHRHFILVVHGSSGSPLVHPVSVYSWRRHKADPHNPRLIFRAATRAVGIPPCLIQSPGNLHFPDEFLPQGPHGASPLWFLPCPARRSERLPSSGLLYQKALFALPCSISSGDASRIQTSPGETPWASGHAGPMTICITNCPFTPSTQFVVGKMTPQKILQMMQSKSFWLNFEPIPGNQV